jgi:cellulose synthase-like protein
MVQGCDARVMHDGHGDDIVPCECEFRICVDCFTLRKQADSKMERGMSLVKQADINKSGKFDHNRWLFETKGTYGYGNAIWPQDGVDDDGDGGAPGGQPKELLTKPWRPLTRKLRIPAAIISPYRYRLHFTVILIPRKQLLSIIACRCRQLSSNISSL